MKSVFGLTPLALLAACAPSVDAPSLMPRAIEKGAPVRPAPPATACVDADRDAAIATTLEQVRGADNDFTRALSGASTSAAPESEAWIAAQSARSEAEIIHGRVIDAIGSLDERAQALTNTGCDIAPYVEAGLQAQAIADRESERLTAFSVR